MKNIDTLSVFPHAESPVTYCTTCRQETGSRRLSKCKSCYGMIEDEMWVVIPPHDAIHNMLRYDISKIIYLDNPSVVRDLIKRSIKKSTLPPNLSDDDVLKAKENHSNIIEGLKRWLDKWYPEKRTGLC